MCKVSVYYSNSCIVADLLAERNFKMFSFIFLKICPNGTLNCRILQNLEWHLIYSYTDLLALMLKMPTWPLDLASKHQELTLQVLN